MARSWASCRAWTYFMTLRRSACPRIAASVAKIQQLSPKDNTQRSLQAQALSIAIGAAQTRWLMYEQSASSVPLPLLVVLVLWLTIIFISFGPLRRSECNSDRQLVCLRAIGLLRDPPDSGDVQAFRRTDSDLQRRAAHRTRTSWPVAHSKLFAL